MPAPRPEACVLGVDIGAGSLKVTVVDAAGRDLGSASRGYPTRSPHPGWSEQDPEDWWRALCDCVPRALAVAQRSAADVLAVSFSAGAHTPVLLDAHGRVLRPAILWSDQRSGAEARELQECCEGEILRVALNRPTPTWTLPQLLWLTRHEPAIAHSTKRLMVAKDWLRFRLTETWHTDVTDAVGTLLWDHANAAWSPALCALADWDVATLPPVVQPTTITGEVTRTAALQCGLMEGTPVVCGTSDTSIEAFGAGAAAPGAAIVKLATAGTLCVIDDQPHVHRTLINYPFAVPGLWYTIAATNSCASAHRWLRDQFFLRPGEDGAAAFEAMDHLAAAVAPGSEGLLFHPYLLGERAPYWDPMLRADFVGITMRHTSGHFVRALYEGIAFSLRDVLGEFRAQGLAPKEVRIIGGGARSALWRQVIADVLRLRIVLPLNTDASYGAALLAGVGCGLFADERTAASLSHGVRGEHSCDERRAASYDELYQLYRDAKERLTDINHRLYAFAAASSPP